MKENQTIVESRDMVWLNTSFHIYFNTKMAFNKSVNLNDTREESTQEEAEEEEPSETPPSSRKRGRSDSE
jgi:hypothetical protein